MTLAHLYFHSDGCSTATPHRCPNSSLGVSMCKLLAAMSLMVLIQLAPLSAGAPPIHQSNENQEIDIFVDDAPVFMKGKSFQEIKNLGKLRHEAIDKIPNKHNPQNSDTFVTLQYDGLEIYGYLKTQNELWPIHIVVTKPQWKINDGLCVGAPVSLIEKVLGKPIEKEKNIVKYCGETDCIHFYISKEAISKVEFYYYFD